MKRNMIVGLAAGAGAAWAYRQWRTLRQPGFNGSSVVITGGSRGLGLELARRFAAEGARVAIVARDGEELERARKELEARGATVLPLERDLRDPGVAEDIVRSVTQVWGRIDVLINNAGIIQVGPLDHMEQSDFDEAMDVHAWAPLHLMRAAIPVMEAAGGGRIVNISSIGGLVAVPHLLPYVMSKFALTGLSAGMRSELAGSNIKVVTVCPGLMRTGSHVNALFKGQHEKEFSWFALASALPLLSTDISHAARVIIGATRRGDPQVVITPQARLLHLLDTLAPNLIARMMTLTQRMLPGKAGFAGDYRRKGWQSTSEAAPSFLTRLIDRAAFRNNELFGTSAAAYANRDE